MRPRPRFVSAAERSGARSAPGPLCARLGVGSRPRGAEVQASRKQVPWPCPPTHLELLRTCSRGTARGNLDSFRFYFLLGGNVIYYGISKKWRTKKCRYTCEFSYPPMTFYLMLMCTTSFRRPGSAWVG
uniref:Uncharacterized protein n=1 Tax=Molossus molossus TaxID=27622 RepID=A0A7J8DQ24_MOLMO|nr:hypothetical protein HJG59_009264 [Molossus molossus]